MSTQLFTGCAQMAWPSSLLSTSLLKMAVLLPQAFFFFKLTAGLLSEQKQKSQAGKGDTFQSKQE